VSLLLLLLLLLLEMSTAELVVVLDVVDARRQRPVPRLGQRQRQEPARDRQRAEDEQRQTAPPVPRVGLAQVVDVRVEDAAEPTGERAHPGTGIPAALHDTIRDANFTCAQKPTCASLIYRTEPTTEKWKTEKN